MRIDFFDKTVAELLSQDPKGKAKLDKVIEDIARQMGDTMVYIGTVKEEFINFISSESK